LVAISAKKLHPFPRMFTTRVRNEGKQLRIR
jgi:hypothetical protein